MNVYRNVTERILNQLQAGVVPWRKTWTSGLPKSLRTGKTYRGINILLLGLASSTSRYWTTFLEAKKVGGYVKKGQRASVVVYWKWRTEEELQKLRNEKGVEVSHCFPFVSAVFNLDQVEGIARPADDIELLPGGINLERAEQVYDLMPEKPDLRHSVSGNPCYAPHDDCVVLPHKSQFESADAYYATLFHELVHATAHPKRLNRCDLEKPNTAEAYSFEELVAELGAAFLCATAGVQNAQTETLQASYIDGWIKTIRGECRSSCDKSRRPT
jgi:antirestriction protein ArdC